jgi:hypothetical protein
MTARLALLGDGAFFAKFVVVVAEGMQQEELAIRRCA